MLYCFGLASNKNSPDKHDLGLRLGLGIHYQALPASYLTIVRNTLLNLWVEELFYSTATVFMKLSILAFYWRIFNVASIRWPIRVLAACVISWLVARVGCICDPECFG